VFTSKSDVHKFQTLTDNFSTIIYFDGILLNVPFENGLGSFYSDGHMFSEAK
jgi:hypothetical protein